MSGVILVAAKREAESLAQASCDALNLRYARYEKTGGALDALQHLLRAERDACVDALDAYDAADDDASRGRARQDLRALRARVWRRLGAAHRAELERVEHMHCFALPVACPPAALARALSSDIADDRLPSSLSAEFPSLRAKIDRRQAREVSTDGVAGFAGLETRQTTQTTQTTHTRNVGNVCDVSVNDLLDLAYRDIFAEGHVFASASDVTLHYLFGAESGSLNGRLSGYEFKTSLCAFLGSLKRGERGDDDLGERARTALREFAEESAIHLPARLASEMDAALRSAVDTLRRTRSKSDSVFVPSSRPEGPVLGVWIKRKQGRGAMKTLFVLRVGEGLRLRFNGEDVAVEHLGVDLPLHAKQAGLDKKEQKDEYARASDVAEPGTAGTAGTAGKYIPPHRR